MVADPSDAETGPAPDAYDVDLATAGRLAAGLAHDLRHLLVTLGLNLEVMARRSQDEPTRRRAAALVTGVEDAVDLLRRFGDVARPLGGVEPGDGPAGCLVDGAVTALAILLGPCLGAVELQLDLTCPGHVVAIEAVELRRAVLNLALNAISALEGTGRLTISTRAAVLAGLEDDLRPRGRRGDFVLLEVVDDGPGFEVALVAPAGVAIDGGTAGGNEGGTSERQVWGAPGRGMGLANTAAVVAAAGGAISVHSSPATGSRFGLYLPSPSA